MSEKNEFVETKTKQPEVDPETRLKKPTKISVSKPKGTHPRHIHRRLSRRKTVYIDPPDAVAIFEQPGLVRDSGKQDPMHPVSFFDSPCIHELCGADSDCTAQFDRTYKLSVPPSIVSADRRSGVVLSDLEPAANMSERAKMVFKAVGKVLVKATALQTDNPDKSSYENSMNEAYNEAIIGAFMTNYVTDRHLSPCFVRIVDWFKCTKLPIMPNESYPDVNYQYVVIEKAEMDLLEFVRQAIEGSAAADVKVDRLRSVLFMVLHALEMGWAAREFIHYDMHVNNIMLEEVPVVEGAPPEAHWAFQRANGDWYRIDPSNTGKMLVKIIDYGRSRMIVDDISGITLVQYCPGFENYGVLESANRSWDVRRLAWNLMHRIAINETLRTKFLSIGENVLAPLVGMLRTAMGYDKYMQYILDNRWNVLGVVQDDPYTMFNLNRYTVALERAIGRVKSSPLKLLELYRDGGHVVVEVNDIFLYSAEKWEWTSRDLGVSASSLLDHEFFAPLKMPHFSESASVTMAVANQTMLMHKSPLARTPGDPNACVICSIYTDVRDPLYEPERVPICSYQCRAIQLGRNPPPPSQQTLEARRSKSGFDDIQVTVKNGVYTGIDAGIENGALVLFTPSAKSDHTDPVIIFPGDVPSPRDCEYELYTLERNESCRGMARMVMCVTLKRMFEHGVINNDSMISLYAAGEIDGDFRKLVMMYVDMGAKAVGVVFHTKRDIKSRKLARDIFNAFMKIEDYAAESGIGGVWMVISASDLHKWCWQKFPTVEM